MDLGRLRAIIDQKFPAALLEGSRFGRAGDTLVWIESVSIAEVAQLLKENEETQLDWLEHMSVMEIEDTLVITYFLRSRELGHRILLRVSGIVSNPLDEVAVPSVTQVWPMAELMEKEAHDLFGVRFSDESKGRFFLPEDWRGFPLRKKYETSH